MVTRARIGLGGVAATPIRAFATEAALEGQPWTEQTVDEAAEVMRGEGTPLDDHRASAAYRSAMLGTALRKLWAEAVRMSVGQPLPHESAALHVTGHALYTDDLVHRTHDVLHAHPVCSPHAHARVLRLDTSSALEVAGRGAGADRPTTCPASTTPG